MNSKFKKRVRAQAIAELAIMGSLIMVAFSMILSYGHRLDRIQNLKMKTFREALRKAYYKNSTVNVTKRVDSRSVDLFNFGKGQPSTAQASAAVMWHKGMPGAQDTNDAAFSFYSINGVYIGEYGFAETTGLPRYHKTVIGATGAESEIHSPVSVYREESKRYSFYSGNKEKSESEDGIENVRYADLRDDLDIKVKTRFDAAKYDSRLGPDDPEQESPKYTQHRKYDLKQTAVFDPLLDDDTITYKDVEDVDSDYHGIHVERTRHTPN
ncbi:MAG: hypothetical protein GY858_06095 [Candidatus Omnitrophica bacterium]|nr:hypothetical protein [Candidatus Omnitrophota bacterium]